eukprot:7735753-Alexandrium_andersonii.AAC.1
MWELESVRLLPLAHLNSCHAVATRVLPKGFYACEAVPVAERELARLRGRIAEYLGPGPGIGRPPALTYESSAWR